MERSVLIVAATHRAAQIRDHFLRLGLRMTESPWEGPTRGLCFALPPDGTAAPPAFLSSVLAELPFVDEIPPALTGPLSGLAERLSGALRLDVMVVHRSVRPAREILVVWVAGAVERVDLLSGNRRREWAAALPSRPSERVAGEPWQNEVERFLTTRPLTQSPGRGGETDGPDPWSAERSNNVRNRFVVLAILLGAVALAGSGKAAGDRFGHGDLGGTIGFFLAPATLTVVALKRGILGRPSLDAWKPAGLAATGVVLVGVARVLNGTSAAPGFGTAGLALVAVAIVWGYATLFPRRTNDDGLPDD